MTYKKNDILIFMSKAPGAHVCEMFGHGIVKPEDAERESYYGFVKSVISASKGIYLMQTLKPLKSFFCVAEDADIIRKVNKNELPKEEREREYHKPYEVPNVYIPAQNSALSMLTEQDHCIALAKEVLLHLFPNIPAIEFKFNDTWFSKSGFISQLDFFDVCLEKIKDSEMKRALIQLKGRILKDLQSARFKEYYDMNVEVRTENEGVYFIAAVSKEFDEVCILRDITERGCFFRSLGPEFYNIMDALKLYQGKVADALIATRKTTIKN